MNECGASSRQGSVLLISVRAVEVVCPCGGRCENEDGSVMIGFFDKVVWCRLCQECYEVSAAVFGKFHQSLEGDVL